MQLITSLQHPLVKTLVKLRDKRSERYRQQQIVVEGENMLVELLANQQPIHFLAQQDHPVPDALQHLISAPSTVMVSAEVMAKVSDCRTPPGLLAVLSMPNIEVTAQPQKSRRLLVLDRLTDPGNVGTLLRTALALGWDAVFLLEGCCDPFNPKAIRAAKGATFHLPMAIGTFDDLLPLLADKIVLTADLKGEQASAYVDHPSIALVLGNEAHGPDKAFSAHTSPVTIPMSRAVESLNAAVAGAILMDQLRVDRA
jgi:TrmH family RNA methyltransferase